MTARARRAKRGIRQAYKRHAWGSVKDRTDPDSCTLANRARDRACPRPPRPRRYHAHVASSHPRPEANVPDDLLLKVTPPRVPRHLVTRVRLQAEHEPWASHPLVLVRAPAGYGKTSLLAQWRREHLARGRVVAWVMAQALDYEARFVAALAYAVRVGAGRPGFGNPGGAVRNGATTETGGRGRRLFSPQLMTTPSAFSMALASSGLGHLLPSSNSESRCQSMEVRVDSCFSVRCASFLALRKLFIGRC